MTLSISKITYQEAIENTIDPDLSSSWTEEEYLLLPPYWVVHSLRLHDFRDETLPSYEVIIKSMNGPE